MKLYRFFWNTHRWTGIILALVFLNLAGTGFLLLKKKDYAWVQPPVQKGASGGVADFITLQELFQIVFNQGHPDFRSLEDIDRVDFRPEHRVHKVRSRHHHSEIQVDAVTGGVLSVDWRPSDLLESLHDGSFFAGWVHEWFMPVVPFGLLFLSGSGLYLWLAPKIRRRRHRGEKRRQRQAQPTA